MKGSCVQLFTKKTAEAVLFSVQLLAQSNHASDEGQTQRNFQLVKHFGPEAQPDTDVRIKEHVEPFDFLHRLSLFFVRLSSFKI